MRIQYFRSIVAVVSASAFVFSACASGGSETTSTTPLASSGDATETSETTEAAISGVEADQRLADPASDPVGLNLRGTTGAEIVINRLWIQGCIPGANGIDWQDSSRVLVTTVEPFELVTTLVDYQNGSLTPDCRTGRVGSSTFTQAVEFLDVQVPFGWVDAAGNDADAPPGLELVTAGNGMQGIMTAANVTPESQDRVDQLNAAEFCGVDDWQVEQTQDTLLCFNGGAEPVSGRTLLIIDDRELPWKNYQAGLTSTLDQDGFPNQVPNLLPFEGPFEP